MAEIFTLSGAYSIAPSSGSPSGDPNIVAPVQESMYLSDEVVDRVTLASDATVNVDFGDMSGANVIIMRATGGKVTARVTSADGTTQSIPVDPLMILMSASVPVTAIDLTRVPSSGTTVTVKVLLGAKQ